MGCQEAGGRRRRKKKQQQQGTQFVKGTAL